MMRSAAPSAPQTRRAAGTGVVVAALAGLSWRRLRRDPLGLVFTLVLPVAIAAVMSTVYVSETAGSAEIGVLEAPADPVAHHLVARLEANPLLEVRSFPDREALDGAVRRRQVDAGVVVGTGAATSDATVEIVGPPGVAAPSGVRAAVESAAAETSATVQLGRALVPTDPLGTGFAVARFRLAEAGMATDLHGPDAAVTDAHRDDWAHGATGYAVMATVVLFVFMNTAAVSSWWAEARALGVVPRLRSTGASPHSVAGGVALGLVSYAWVQGALVLVAGRALFGLPLRSPGSLVVVLVATALAAGGIGLLVASVLPTATAGPTVAGPLMFVLAMLGGCLWPLEIVPAALATLGRATPHLWAVEGLRATAVHGHGPAAVVGPLAVLVAVGLATGAAGALRMARFPWGDVRPCAP